MKDGEILTIGMDQILPEVMRCKADQCRLVQICAAKAGERYEITYTFGKEYACFGLRIVVDADTRVMSITDMYPSAFLYENEIHDLFGIPIDLISLDYEGNLYRIKAKTPFK